MLESQSINTFKTRLDKALVDVYLRTIQFCQGTGLEDFKRPGLPPEIFQTIMHNEKYHYISVVAF